MAEEWKRRAEKAGVSTSRFVIERVENSIGREEGEEGYLSRAELIKRLKEAEEEIKRLRSENNLLKKLVENLDNELKRYRAKPFAEESFEGVRRFDKELIKLLKKGGTPTAMRKFLPTSTISTSSPFLTTSTAIGPRLTSLSSISLIPPHRLGSI
jgi:predicted nuclease with TOPRIM domain